MTRCFSVSVGISHSTIAGCCLTGATLRDKAGPICQIWGQSCKSRSHVSPRVVSFKPPMALLAGIPACGHSRLRAFPLSEGIYEIGSSLRDLPWRRCPAT